MLCRFFEKKQKIKLKFKKRVFFNTAVLVVCQNFNYFFFVFKLNFFFFLLNFIKVKFIVLTLAYMTIIFG